MATIILTLGFIFPSIAIVSGPDMEGIFKSVRARLISFAPFAYKATASAPFLATSVRYWFASKMRFVTEQTASGLSHGRFVGGAEEVRIVERYVTAPLRNGALKVASHLAAMHHGRINDYAGYGLLTLIIGSSHWP